jgi:hypothetical protein
MNITERIHNAIEWANKRLTLQGQELSQEQKNYLTFALSQNFTNNYQALQLQQTDVIKSECEHDWKCISYISPSGVWTCTKCKKTVG